VRVHDRLRLFSRAGSLGGIESLASIPARMSHRHLDPDQLRSAGIDEGLIRLSIGLEAPGDLISDLDQALSGGTRP
jgi:cystathionine beta-lyase/cystathionine gamma-synthase